MASRSRSRAATRAKLGGARAPPRGQRRAPAPEPARFDTSRSPLLRALAAHQDRTAAGLFALFVLVYLWPVLLGGKILSPISLVYGVTPWQNVAPPDLGNYLNPLLSDIAAADYPWRFFARGLIREGTLPAWNPHVFAGIPFFSNPQSGIFSPFSLPLWILPLNYAIGVGAALKLWAGGFGSYLLVRQLRLGFLPGLLAGVCFSFSAINIVWLTHETLPAVAVMLPWMIWCIERIFERGRLGSVIGLAVASAFALGGGHPGMQLHALVAGSLYVALRTAFLRGAWDWARLRPLALAGGGLALGTLLMAVMLIPEALSNHGTIGTLARQGSRGILPGQQMPFDAIKSIAFPDWWGRPSAVGSTPSSTGAVTAGDYVNYNERTFYPGAVALLLACAAFVSGDRWRRKAPFAVLAVIGLAIPLHGPGLFWLVEHLPGLKLVQNQRLHFVFGFATAVLAAFGLQALLDRSPGERGRLAVAGAGVLAALVAFATVGASSAVIGDTIRHFVSGRDVQSNGVLALTSVAWFGLFAVGVAVAVTVAWRWPRRTIAMGALVVALAVGDMLHFATGYQPMAPASKIIPPITGSVAYVKEHAQDGRFFGVNYALLNDWSGTYGLDDVRGYDPPQPSGRYFRLWQTANPGQVIWQSFSFDTLTPAALRVIDVLGARYIMTTPGVKPPRGSDPVARDVRTVYAGADATVFTNAGAVPRAMVASKVRLTGGEEETREALVESDADPRRVAVVERDQPGVAGLDGRRVRGTVAVAHEENASVTLRATLDRRGLVVLNDNFTDGWKVRVDGHPAQPLHANDVMRGVVVGAGRHEIVWSYTVPGLRAGLALSLLAFAALAAGGVALVVRRRRRA